MRVAPVLERYGDFAGFLAQPVDEAAWRRLRMSETSGRPLGSDAWITAVETRTGWDYGASLLNPKIVAAFRNGPPSAP